MMTQNHEQLLKVQQQYVYRTLDSSIPLQAVKRIGKPHKVQTTVGVWIHIPIIQNNQVFDPADALIRKMIIPKQHSIYVYNPYLKLQQGLDNIQIKDFFKVPEEAPNKVPLGRIHSSCRFGDTFGSLTCDCGPQLFAAKKAVVENGFGFILYLEQQGRNLGLLLKAAVCRILDVYKIPTHESFAPLKIKQNDLRTYDVAVETFKLFGVDKLSLLTNNPSKFEYLRKNGIEVVQKQISIKATQFNKQYLLAKKTSMGHATLDPQNDLSAVDKPTKIAQVVNKIHQTINSQNVDVFQKLVDSEHTKNDQTQGYAAFFNEKKHPKYFFLANFYQQFAVTCPQEGTFRCNQGLYQYQKFKHLKDQRIRRDMQKFDGAKAWKMSRQLAHRVVDNWQNTKADAMMHALKIKFSNPVLKQKLLATGSKYLFQNCHRNLDPYWADNGDGTGKNMMGVLLMQLRQQYGGVGIVQRPKSLEAFYSSKCKQCDDPCLFTNDGQLKDRCTFHQGFLQL